MRSCYVCVCVCERERERERKRKRKRKRERERKMPGMNSESTMHIYCTRKGPFLILVFAHANTIAGVGGHKMTIFILQNF